jgi:glycosyltransferase involved in cell wall biosynthesis
VRIIGTMMVRDEIDIVAAMVEHHLAQGVDLLIVTDNGSVDGTTEVLAEYARSGRVELHHDPVHRKQQSQVVTGMARRARTEHRADWVLNLDADEFLAPLDRSLSVRECLEQTSLALNAFTVPATNLVGPAAWAGSGVGRLEWRDHRTDEQLRQIGIWAQPTPTAIHRGESDITVAQGNHFVSLVSNGQPEPAFAMELLHLPWRSWAQLERKVLNAGRSYENNPELRPSPNHHGMKDYRRYQEGWLRDAYLARTPTRAELRSGESDGSYVVDTWLTGQLRGLLGRALLPDALKRVVVAENDHPVPEDEHETGASAGRARLAAEEPMRPRERPAAQQATASSR